MKRKVKFFILITLMVILTACNKEQNNADSLEFYILRHVEGESYFVIDEKPIFTGEDILSYDWDTHTIAFNKKFLSSRNIDEIEDDIMIGGSQILGIYYPDQFAFYLNGEEIYSGYMKPQAFISFMPVGPMISDSEKGIIINNNDSENDIRDDENLYEFLKDNDLLM